MVSAHGGRPQGRAPLPRKVTDQIVDAANDPTYRFWVRCDGAAMAARQGMSQWTDPPQ